MLLCVPIQDSLGSNISTLLDDYGDIDAAVAADAEEGWGDNFKNVLNMSSTLSNNHLQTQRSFIGGASAVGPELKLAVVLVCTLFGVLSLLLNVWVITALLRNRRRVLRNVFYVLVFHCSVVDLIRGGCLIMWGVPYLLIGSMQTMGARLLALKINQFTLVALRSCNLLTIFNLLLFTTNEFIVIKYPLHYRRRFRRPTVLVVLAISWLVSLMFGVGSIFSSVFDSRSSSVRMGRRNGTLTVMRDGSPTRSISVNVLSMSMIFILCYLCLLTVLVCYGVILYKIRQFHNVGSNLGQPEKRSLYQPQYCRHHHNQQHRNNCRHHGSTGSHHSQQSRKSGKSVQSHVPLAPATSTATNYYYNVEVGIRTTGKNALNNNRKSDDGSLCSVNSNGLVRTPTDCTCCDSNRLDRMGDFSNKSLQS